MFVIILIFIIVLDDNCGSYDVFCRSGFLVSVEVVVMIGVVWEKFIWLCFIIFVFLKSLFGFIVC